MDKFKEMVPIPRFLIGEVMEIFKEAEIPGVCDHNVGICFCRERAIFEAIAEIYFSKTNKL